MIEVRKEMVKTRLKNIKGMRSKIAYYSGMLKNEAENSSKNIKKLLLSIIEDLDELRRQEIKEIYGGGIND